MIPGEHSGLLRTLYGVFLLGVLPLAAGTEDLVPLPWEEALAQAARENRYLYVAFLGTDWSVSSDRFKKNVLQAEPFQELVRERLVYYPVQARRKPRLGKQETARLQALVIHFDIKAYPTLILLAPDGEEILRHGYREMEAAAYVDLVRSVLPSAD